MWEDCILIILNENETWLIIFSSSREHCRKFYTVDHCRAFKFAQSTFSDIDLFHLQCYTILQIIQECQGNNSAIPPDTPALITKECSLCKKLMMNVKFYITPYCLWHLWMSLSFPFTILIPFNSYSCKNENCSDWITTSVWQSSPKFFIPITFFAYARLLKASVSPYW